jgi:hypothetical protein
MTITLSIVDASNGKVIRSLVNGNAIDPSTLPAKWSVRADITGATVGSVRFTLDGAQHVESKPPYSAAGDNPDGSYTPLALGIGAHTLKVEVFAGPITLLGSESIGFTLTRAAPWVQPSTAAIVNRTDGAHLGNLLLRHDDRAGCAVQMAGKNQRIDSITQLGTASALFASGSQNLDVGFLDSSEGDPREYGEYNGGDATPTIGMWIHTLEIVVAGHVDPTHKLTEKELENLSGYHGIRTHVHRGCVYGDPDRKLDLPPNHPAYGRSGYIKHDSPYPGAAITCKESMPLSAAEMAAYNANRTVPVGYRTIFQNMLCDGPAGGGPLTVHLDDETRSPAIRNNERTFLHYRNMEIWVRDKFLDLTAGCDGLVENVVIRAKVGAKEYACINLEGPRTSKDGFAKWPGAVATISGSEFYGESLFTQATAAYVKANPGAVSFASSTFNDKAIGPHGEI